MKKFWGLMVVLMALMVLGGVVVVSASSGGENGADDAVGPIIIDHTCTDISQIPDYWLEKAKEQATHYGHTSHGSQITSGLLKLEQVDPRYSFHRFWAYDAPPSSLPAECADALCLYDGNPPNDTYIAPEDYWSTADGISRTRAVADTGLFAYSMWSWCGQQSTNSEETVQQYLNTMSNFESLYPAMRFILMTGHTDGGSATLERNNGLVRQYAREHDMILFDFADIETYDPLGGGPYVNNSEGNCSWCVDFCAAHPDYCTDLPDTCAHTADHPEDRLFCKLKANAYWWMMARLAGWPGPGGTEIPDMTPSAKTAAVLSANAGQVVTYTIVVRHAASPLSATVRLSDAVPTGLLYLSGTLTATRGTISDTLAPLLRWSGPLTPTPAVTLTYAVQVVATTTTFITNVVEFVVGPGSWGEAQRYTRSAQIVINGFKVYLPLVMRTVP